MIVNITRPSTGLTYTVTTEHSASSYGIPVVLLNGELVDFADSPLCHGLYSEDDSISTPGEVAAYEQRGLESGLRAGAQNEEEHEMVACAYYMRAYLPLAARTERDDKRAAATEAEWKNSSIFAELFGGAK